MQTWTVIRNQNDFTALAETLSSSLSDVPQFPAMGVAIHGDDVNTLVAARNQQQQWLNSVLMHPSARESAAVGKFLTADANFIPPHYENVPWTMFTATGQVAAPAAPPPPQPQDYASPPATPQATAAVATPNLDDMVMEDMFDNGDDFGPEHPDDTDDEEEYRSSERYKPTDEPITEEDEMDIAQMADEVEMIADVGSLAQSLGASHLGRSLMLQEEISGGNRKQPPIPEQASVGLQLGRAISGGGGGSNNGGGGSSSGGGGIGVAMQNATPGLGGSFAQTKPESPPRLDAFKMVKVIGKGSFGKHSSFDIFSSPMPCLETLADFFSNNCVPAFFFCRQSFLGQRNIDRPDVCSQGVTKRQHRQTESGGTYQNRAQCFGICEAPVHRWDEYGIPIQTQIVLRPRLLCRWRIIFSFGQTWKIPGTSSLFLCRRNHLGDQLCTYIGYYLSRPET